MKPDAKGAGLRLVFWPIGKVARWQEKTHILQRTVDAITSADGQVGVRPVFDFVTGYRATVGASVFNRRLLGEDTNLQFSLSSNFSNVWFTDFALRPTHANRAIEYTAAGFYNRRDDYLYTGIGMATARTHLGGRYSIDEAELHNHVDFVLNRHVTLLLDGMFGVRRFGDGVKVGDDLPIEQVFCAHLVDGRCVSRAVDASQVPGFYTGTQFLRGGATLRIDTRDSVHRPTSGAMFQAGADYSHGLGAEDPSSYFRIHAVLVTVLDLWRRNRILVLRASTDAVYPMGGADVPFSELETLGGPADLRGVRLGKYRDYSRVMFTAEYRWPIWM